MMQQSRAPKPNRLRPSSPTANDSHERRPVTHRRILQRPPCPGAARAATLQPTRMQVPHSSSRSGQERPASHKAREVPSLWRRPMDRGTSAPDPDAFACDEPESRCEAPGSLCACRHRRACMTPPLAIGDTKARPSCADGLPPMLQAHALNTTRTGGANLTQCHCGGSARCRPQAQGR